jgi:uncharacterized membrane protein YfcA
VIQELFGALSATTLFTDPASAALVAGVVFIAYVAFGVSGFGSALIAVPIIAHVWPLTVVVPLFALFEIVAAVTVGGSHWKSVERRELMTLVPFMLAGIAIGVTLLLSLPSPWLLVGLGAFVLCYGLRGALKKNRAFAKVSRLWAVPTGLVGGVMSALFGTGGSFYLIYVAGRVEDKGALRATLSTVLGTKLPGPGAIYLSQTLRFKAPVRAGDTVVARATVKELLPEKRRCTLTTTISVDDKVVLEGEAVVLVAARPVAATPARVAAEVGE